MKTFRDILRFAESNVGKIFFMSDPDAEKLFTIRWDSYSRLRIYTYEDSIIVSMDTENVGYFLGNDGKWNGEAWKNPDRITGGRYFPEMIISYNSDNSSVHVNFPRCNMEEFIIDINYSIEDLMNRANTICPRPYPWRKIVRLFDAKLLEEIIPIENKKEGV